MVNQPSPEHTLARLAVTGTFHGTFHAAAEERLARARDLADQVSPELVAKVAAYCREHRKEVDLPALLVANLAARDVATMNRVFTRVVDDGATLRSFVRIVRSGVTGRKSFGSAPKRALRAWFAARTPDVVFRHSIGQDPSMSDVIKMVRPPPRNDEGEADAVREALYGYLIGKSVDSSALPPLAKAFDAFKRGEGPVPDVPFEMLTALPLRAEHWTDLATKMTASQLRVHLTTLARLGILDAPELEAIVATTLADAEGYRHGRVMPFDVLASLRTADERVPASILSALALGLEHATANVPRLDGRVVIAPDVSGSMRRSLGGARLRLLDVAALVTAVVLRRSTEAKVAPFADDVLELDPPPTARDPVLATLDRLGALPIGNTRCPLERLVPASFDLLVVVTDALIDLAQWDAIRAASPDARLVVVDLRRFPRPFPYRPDVLHVAGFSDSVFDVLTPFVRGDLQADHLRAIESVVL